MCNICNIRLPQAMRDVISSIGIGTAAADSIGYGIGCQHGIGLTLVEWSMSEACWSLLAQFQTGQGPRHTNLHKQGLAQSPSCDCGQPQIMNHSWHVPTNKIWIWKWTETTPWSRWWRSHMAEINSDHSTRKNEIKYKCVYNCAQQFW